MYRRVVLVLHSWVLPAPCVTLKELVVPLLLSTTPLVLFVHLTYTLLPVQLVQLLCLIIHIAKSGVFARR